MTTWIARNDDSWRRAARLLEEHSEAQLQPTARHRRSGQSRGRDTKCLLKNLPHASEVQKLAGQQVAPCPLPKRRRLVGRPAAAGKLSGRRQGSTLFTLSRSFCQECRLFAPPANWRAALTGAAAEEAWGCGSASRACPMEIGGVAGDSRQAEVLHMHEHNSFEFGFL